jgi:hypothetical protein
VSDSDIADASNTTPLHHYSRSGYSDLQLESCKSIPLVASLYYAIRVAPTPISLPLPTLHIRGGHLILD